MRLTSRIAYKNIIESGKTDSQKYLIIRLLKTEQPLSRREISWATNIEIWSVSGWVNEMLKLGILEEAKMRKCMFSKKLIKPVQLSESL